MPDSAQAAGKHLRIGGQDQVLMYNRESDDATLPEMSPQGVATSEALPVGAWECFEYHLGTDGSIETWLNSAAIPGLFTKGNLNDAGWAASTIIPKITGVYFGWESYSGDVNTFWYDDIAISSTRVGCGGSASSSVAATTSTTSSKSSTGTTGTTLTTSVKSSTTTSAVKTSTTTSAAATSSTAVAGSVPLYGQCGGINYTGLTGCATGTCHAYSAYYSQCIP